MSSFQRLTINPKTGNEEMADWIDDYFDKHVYGIKFADGEVYKEEFLEGLDKYL
jgi:hypothetical protein